MTIVAKRINKDVVHYFDENDNVLFVIAKDSMGTQICQNGKFFPDSKDFGSIEAALDFISGREQEAVEFFKTAQPKFQSLGDIAIEIAMYELRKAL